MALRKTAEAMVIHPRVSGRDWNGIRRVASKGSSDRNLTDQAREILGGALDPDKYLFTHCTIVASVDTEDVPNAKLGKVRLGSTGPTIDRRYADFHIKPVCTPFVNNNGDSWSRQVLAASFPTFIGGQNFQEHVQIASKSKGRILDAVARDIGDSLYVDILVATNRKHATLIQDIKSGRMGTLSMGCTTDFTICSKCGHVAIDETELCEHIRHAKLNTFMDGRGQQRVIAELCGHVSYTENPEAPGGVRFIEASWVGVPAFPGAVMRNILSTGETQIPESDIRRLLAAAPSSWSEQAILKAASLQVRAFDFGGGGDDDGDGEKPAKEEPKKAPFQDAEDELYNDLKKRVTERVRSELREHNAPKPESSSTMEPNDNLQKEAAAKAAAKTAAAKTAAAVGKSATQGRYAASITSLVRAASSDVALVDGLARVNQSFGVRVSVDAYRAALRAGPISNYSQPKDYLQSCRKHAGRVFTLAELRVVVRVGSLLSQMRKRPQHDNQE